jgi:hypothetical protein
LPAVSATSATPSASATSSSGVRSRRLIGRFTPKGLSVSARQRRISARNRSGFSSPTVPICPSPPALETAAASSA